MSGRGGGRPRVLVVDDSDLARDLLVRGLGLDAGLEVVGQAADVWEARDRIIALEPDVMTLDVEMPGMDGIEFLRRLMPQYPIPVIVVSAFTAEGSRRALEALEAGAIDVVGKPTGKDPAGLKDMLLELGDKIRTAAGIEARKLRRPSLPGAGFPSRVSALTASSGPGLSTAKPRLASKGRLDSDLLMAIGASTGGVTAVSQVVKALPPDFPPLVIVQHMPPVFTRLFAQSLDKASAMDVREAADGMRLRPGLALVAAGDFHLRVLRDGDGYLVRCTGGPKISGHRPSADVLFDSVAKAAGARGVGLLLTGMGRDGAEGLLSLRRAGGRCLAQDEETSVVFGMPMEAWRNGAAERLVPLDHCAGELLGLAAGAGRPREGAWA